MYLSSKLADLETRQIQDFRLLRGSAGISATLQSGILARTPPLYSTLPPFSGQTLSREGATPWHEVSRRIMKRHLGGLVDAPECKFGVCRARFSVSAQSVGKVCRFWPFFETLNPNVGLLFDWIRTGLPRVDPHPPGPRSWPQTSAQSAFVGL